MIAISDIAIGAAVCLAVLAVVWAAKEVLLMPVRREKGADVFAVVRAAGEAEGLEQLVRGLLWLRDSGKAEMDIVIAGDGLTPEAETRARLLAEKCGGVFCPPEKIACFTEDSAWRERDSQQ